MAEPKRPSRAVETASPARNFTLESETRFGAIVAGPPAYMRRLRRIEDLNEDLRRRVAALLDGAGDHEVARAEAKGTRAIKLRLEELNHLIDAHNRYYPIEANLPRGKRFVPMRPATLDALLESATELRVQRG